MASLTGLLSLYTFHPGDTIYVDTGAYDLVRNVTLGPQFSGVRIVGAGPRQVTPSLDGSAILSDNPVAFWRLGDAGGTTAVDATGHGYDGTYIGGVTPDAAAPSNDGAARFDGQTGEVSVPGVSALKLPTFSVEAWVNYQGNQTISAYQFVIVQIGNLNLAYSGGNIFFDGDYAGTSAQAPLTPGVWTDVVATFDSNKDVKLYIDGTLVASHDNAGPPAPSGQPLEIGSGSGTIGGTGAWTGDIDEVALYDKVLTPDQIQAHYASEVYTGTVLNRGNTSPGSYGIELAGATDVTVSNLSIEAGAVGVFAGAGAGSVGLTLNHVDLFGGGTGIDLEASNDGAYIVGSSVHGETLGNGVVGVGPCGIYVASASPTITGNSVYGNEFGISTYGPQPTVTNNEVYANFYGMNVTLLDASQAGSDQGLISGNDVYDNGHRTSGYGISAAISYQTTANVLVVVTGNDVHDNPGNGITTYSEGNGEILVVSNAVNGNGATGIVPADDTEVRDNVVAGNADGISQVIGGGSFGRYNATPDTIDGNRVYGNANLGISALVGSTISGNVVYSNSVGIEGARYVYFDSGGAVKTDLRFSGQISNNLVYGNSTSGISIAGGLGGQIINNTVYEVDGDGVRVTDDMAQEDSYISTQSSSNIELRNNIIVTVLGYGIYVSNDSQQGFSSNYNLLTATGAGKIGYWQTDFGDLRDWQLETGLDAQSITGDPKFADPAGPDGILGVDPTTGIDGGQDDDFHLQNGSPGVAAGDPTSDDSAQPTPTGGRINLGAYGDTPEATTAAAAGLIVVQTGGSTEIAVGGAADSYSVSLTSQPTNDVIITLATDNPLTLSANELTFTPSDWASAKTVSVKQIAQPNISGNYTVTVRQTATSADSRYNGLAVPNVTVRVEGSGASVIPGRTTPSITWAKPASITAGTALSSSQLDAVATVPGSFVYSPGSGTVLGVGNGQSLSVTFFPTDSADYEQMTATTTIDVLPGTDLTQATLSLSGLDVTYDGNPQHATVITDPPGLAGVTVTYTRGGVAVDEPTQAGTYQVTARLLNPSYQATPVNETLTINMATPVVTWPGPAAITTGTALGSAQLNAVASVPGEFRYSPGPGVCLCRISPDPLGNVRPDGYGRLPASHDHDHDRRSSQPGHYIGDPVRRCWIRGQHHRRRCAGRLEPVGQPRRRRVGHLVQPRRERRRRLPADDHPRSRHYELDRLGSLHE